MDLDFNSGGGVLCDAKTLDTTFTAFGYDVLHFRNLRALQMEMVLSPEYLTDQLKDQGTDLANFESLIICILSHGDKGVVEGVDGVPISLNKLQYALNDGNCSALKGKPKIFVVLACQGVNYQVIANQNPKNQLPLMIKPEVIDTTSSSSFKDFLRLSSTIEEFLTWCKLWLIKKIKVFE